MDELTLLRELDDDPAPLTDAARRAACRRLRLEIADEPPRRRRRDRRGLGGLVAAAAVAGLAAVVVVAVGDGDRGAPSRTPVQLASAAPVLLAAATQARAEPALEYRGDQYLYTRERMREIPVDGRGKTLTFVNEYWRSADGSRPSRVTERGRTWTEAPVASDAVWPPRSAETLEQLPTDPDALVHTPWFRGGNTPADVYETRYMLLGMLLTVELPPQLRAAAYEALARIPDVQVVGTTRQGARRVVEINRPTQPGAAKRVIRFDAGTYDYVGMRETTTRDDGTKVDVVMTQEASAVVDKIGQRPAAG